MRGKYQVKPNSKLYCRLTEAYVLYKSGKTLKEVGKHFGVTDGWIWQLFKKHNLTTRTPKKSCQLKLLRGEMRQARGKDNIKWRGGLTVNHAGYIFQYAPEHSRTSRNGYVFQHILVLEKKIGRFLQKHERVHHINGLRYDNRPENLMLERDHSSHMIKHRARGGKFICPICDQMKNTRGSILIPQNNIAYKRKFGYSSWVSEKNFVCANCYPPTAIGKIDDELCNGYAILRTIVDGKCLAQVVYGNSQKRKVISQEKWKAQEQAWLEIARQRPNFENEIMQILTRNRKRRKEKSHL